MVGASPANGRKGGVMILLRKSLPFHITDKDADKEGRGYPLPYNTKTKDNSQQLRISNIHASNKVYFSNLTDCFLINLSDRHIIGGDFNATVSETEDRKQTKIPKHRHKGKAHSQLKQSGLQQFLQNTSLIDAWRLLNPGYKSYTHYSHVHDSFSRIDLLLLSPSILNQLDKTDITEISLTDHALIALNIDGCSFQSDDDWDIGGHTSIKT